VIPVYPYILLPVAERMPLIFTVKILFIYKEIDQMTLVVGRVLGPLNQHKN
jgi:hypothetical protein